MSDATPAFDFDAIARGLHSTREPRGREPAWLAASRQEPAAFARELLAFATRSDPVRPSSRVGEGYDLYHDLVARHARSGRPALLWHDPVHGFFQLGYDELHRRVSALAPVWSARGVSAGQSVCLVLPLSADYAVALMTALRLGACVTCLPPWGATFLRRRLAALAPQHVVFAPQHARLLGEYAELALPLAGDGAARSASEGRPYAYAEGEPCARVISALSPEPLAPVEVSAQAVYLGAVRDAALVYPILAGDRLAMPGSSPLQHQPSALLATLFGGGCFVVLEREQVAADPNVLVRAGVQVLGVDEPLRAALAAAPDAAFSGLQRWFRDPAEPLDWASWDAFARRLAARDIANFNVASSAAFGGAFLFSPKRMELAGLEVLGAPGVPSALLDVNLSGQPAEGDAGVFAPTVDGEEATAAALRVGLPLLSSSDQGLALVGFLGQHRHGHAYPIQEVAALAETHPVVDGAGLVFGPQPGRVVLVAFADPLHPHDLRLHARARGEALRRLIATELAPAYVPDEVVFCPLFPRRDREGRVDQRWCRSEYQSGALWRKSRDELFRLTSALRRVIARYGAQPLA